MMHTTQLLELQPTPPRTVMLYPHRIPSGSAIDQVCRTLTSYIFAITVFYYINGSIVHVSQTYHNKLWSLQYCQICILAEEKIVYRF